MPERQLALTRGHLFALGALSLALALLTFFIGMEVGGRQSPAAALPAPAGLVPEDVREGRLEALLARVDENRDRSLGFPRELPAPMVALSSDGVPSSGWAVQVAESPEVDRAQRLVDTLRAADLPAYRVAALVDGKAMHRVKIGGFSTEDAAVASLSELQARAGTASASAVPAP